MKRIAWLVAGLALIASGAAAQGKDDPAVAKLRAAYQAALNAQDPAGIAKLYAADGAELPPNAPAANGRAAIEAYHKAMKQQWMNHGITITSTAVRVSGDIAYDAGTYKQQLMSQKDGSMLDDKGKYIVLMKKDASGAWVISHAIYNTDLPLPAAKK
jgi:uncharacterized protein (TIGR02246 family)